MTAAAAGDGKPSKLAQVAVGIEPGKPQGGAGDVGEGDDQANLAQVRQSPMKTPQAPGATPNATRSERLSYCAPKLLSVWVRRATRPSAVSSTIAANTAKAAMPKRPSMAAIIAKKTGKQRTGRQQIRQEVDAPPPRRRRALAKRPRGLRVSRRIPMVRRRPIELSDLVAAQCGLSVNWLLGRARCGSRFRGFADEMAWRRRAPKFAWDEGGRIIGIAIALNRHVRRRRAAQQARFHGAEFRFVR